MRVRELPLPDNVIADLAEAIWAKIVGSNCDPVDLNLRAKLALETRILGRDSVPFGLDKLGTAETASYIGIQPETLRDKVKRLNLGLPAPYSFARKLFWRRSELDAWIEAQRSTKSGRRQPAATVDLRSESPLRCKSTTHPGSARGARE
jgi:hypothetical protein